jgi:hypothetical protein
MKLFISILALFVYLPLPAFSQSDQALAAAKNPSQILIGKKFQQLLGISVVVEKLSQQFLV